ncbi:hypothetical protein CDAR_304591 [Caerostris darwini]|uniref:Uncharacterized protein n=1 Tax=Caerostris darwini TaxID=1538125 RepID=A0AAV4NP20_9ARAC|nr:hypothetical protein CDAR_304591 [Caerostris darwini]
MKHRYPEENLKRGATGGWSSSSPGKGTGRQAGGGSVNGKPLFVPVVLGWPVNLWPDEILEGGNTWTLSQRPGIP